MSRPQQVARPLVRSLRQVCSTPAYQAQPIASRQFSSTPTRKDETPTTTTPTTPEGVAPGIADAALLGKKPVVAGVPKRTEADFEKLLSPAFGSRRRRAALATTGELPFAQLPYQCFQEARKILAEDRKEKIAKILDTQDNIRSLEAADPSKYRGGEAYLQKRIRSLRKYAHELKILADINDPEIKRRFEDGQGDMSKPIYRYLADRKWRSMAYKIIRQRIEQFHIVPDLLPKFDPVMDVQLSFRGRRIAPGSILNSRLTETAPTLRMQVFDQGERFLTVVVVDSDVPDPEKDIFFHRLHMMATNIPWDPTKTALSLDRLREDLAESAVQKYGAVAVPWLPPFSQEGAPYHRLSVFVLQHKEKLDAEKLKEMYTSRRENFSLQRFSRSFDLRAVGFNMFRTVWDESTAGVMERHNIPGADVVFKPQRFKSLKPKEKPRGWEAKRQGPKYRHLWKYTKRIADY